MKASSLPWSHQLTCQYSYRYIHRYGSQWEGKTCSVERKHERVRSWCQSSFCTLPFQLSWAPNSKTVKFPPSPKTTLSFSIVGNMASDFEKLELTWIVSTPPSKLGCVQRGNSSLSSRNSSRVQTSPLLPSEFYRGFFVIHRRLRDRDHSNSYGWSPKESDPNYFLRNWKQRTSSLRSLHFHSPHTETPLWMIPSIECFHWLILPTSLHVQYFGNAFALEFWLSQPSWSTQTLRRTHPFAFLQGVSQNRVLLRLC